MKTEIIKPAPTFTPVTIALTFESQEELDAYGKLFNAGIITGAFHRAFGIDCKLYDIFEKAGANINNIDILFKEIKATFGE